MPKRLIFPSDLSAPPQTPCPSAFRLKDIPHEMFQPENILQNNHSYDFTVATSLVSNFHMPYSTMLMMVAAFGGYDLVMHAYEVAVKEKYRFGAYGDAMLIL